MVYRRLTSSVLGCLVILGIGATAPTPGSRAAQAADEKAVVDQALKTVIAQGVTTTLPSLDDVRARAEIKEPGQVLLRMDVTLQATPAAQHALDEAARTLGGRSLDALIELDFGMVRLEARAARVSHNPGTLEYFQRRVRSLIFQLDLVLEDGGVHRCTTGDVWRIPVAPVTELFAYGGRPIIQGLGVSSTFTEQDYGYVAIRKEPIKFTLKGQIPEADLKKLSRLEGRIVEGTGAESEGGCTRVGQSAGKSPA